MKTAEQTWRVKDSMIDDKCNSQCYFFTTPNSMKRATLAVISVNMVELLSVKLFHTFIFFQKFGSKKRTSRNWRKFRLITFSHLSA